jgi:hypothetical protein
MASCEEAAMPAESASALLDLVAPNHLS